MSPVYYRFYRNMWILRKITAEDLHAKVLVYLTEQEYQDIIETQQVPE